MIPDSEDGVAHISFLSGLKSDRFKFSLAEQKEKTLADTLRKATDFIRATKICPDRSYAPKKSRIPGEKNFNRGDRNLPPGREGRSSRRLILGSPLMPGASSWR